MLECLISFLITILIVAVVIYVLETALALFFPLPPAVPTLLRLIGVLIVLIAGLQCLGVVGGGGPLFFPRRMG